MQDKDLVRVTILGAYSAMGQDMTFGEFRIVMTQDANTYNCGMFRTWEDEESTYFDVGPIVYKVTPRHK